MSTKIIIESRGNRWHWTATTSEDELSDPHGQATAADAAVMAEMHLRQAKLHRHLKAKREEAKKQTFERPNIEA